MPGLRGGMSPKKKIKHDQLLQKELRAACQEDADGKDARIAVDAASSTASTAASSTASSSQRIAQALAAPNSYDSMSLAEPQACCGQKHGNFITTRKKDIGGQWKAKSRQELVLELKNVTIMNMDWYRARWMPENKPTDRH